MSEAPFRALVVGSVATAGLLTVAMATSSPWGIDLASAVLAPAMAAGGLLVGLRRHRPSAPLPWLMLLAATLLVVLPRAAAVRDFVGNDNPALFAVGGLGTVLSVIAPLLLLRRRTGVPDRDGAVDGWIVALSLAALFRQVLVTGSPASPVPAVFTGVLTLVAGVTLAAAVRLVFLSWRLPSAWLLLGAVGAGQAIGLSIARTDLGISAEPTAAIVFGTLNTLLIGLAGAHPSMRQLTVPAHRLDTLPRARLVLLALALLMTVVAVLSEAGREIALSLTGAALVLVVCLVLLRVVRLVSQREHARRLQALVASLGERALDESDQAALLTTACRGLAESLPADLVAVVALPAGSETRAAVLAAQGRGDDAQVLHVSVQSDSQLVREPDDLRGLLPGQTVTAGVPGTAYVVLTHRSRRAASFTVDERTILVTVATLLATALRRQAADARVRHDALHDQLTGLPNRGWLMSALDDIDRDVGGRIGLLFFDLDRFKAVNDTFGHAIGDELLVEVARRLRTGLDPDRHAVARLAGDEFVVVLRPPVDDGAAQLLADQLVEEVRRPFELSVGEVYIGASVGLAIGDGPGHALLHRADAAMYDQKSERRRAPSPSDLPGPRRSAADVRGH